MIVKGVDLNNNNLNKLSASSIGKALDYQSEDFAFEPRAGHITCVKIGHKILSPPPGIRANLLVTGTKLIV